MEDVMKTVWIVGALLLAVGMQQAYHKAPSKWRVRTHAVTMQKIDWTPIGTSTYELHVNKRRFARSGAIEYLMWFSNDDARARLYAI